MSKIERNLTGGCLCTRLYKLTVISILLCIVTPVFAVPPRLHVDGNKVKDPNGNIVILRGVALIDLGVIEEWKGGVLNAVDLITDKSDTQSNSPGWYTKIIRIMITPPDSTSPAGSWPHPFNPDNNDLYNLLRTFVDYCAEKEVYVAIDWHYVANTYDHVATTSEFWQYMAPRFANDSHVIYELFNEPVNPGASDAARWTSVKNDMQTWIDIVRSSAPDNLIFVGTPSYCQIIGPTATDPVDDVNVVYISHIYPLHWLSGSNQYYRDTITAAAAAHPVIIGEWGFTTDLTYDDTWHVVIGNRTDYGEPIKEFVEGIGIGSIAWCAGGWDWGPPMFYQDNTLRIGEGEMGGFAKDWLFEASGVAQTINMTITKCKVNAGKNQGRDDIEASGTLSSSPMGLYLVTHLDINVVSLADGNTIYAGVIPFNADTDLVNNKYKYSYKDIDGRSMAIKADFTKKTFSIKAKNIDLTGLGCPLRLEIGMGNYTLSGEVNETILNAKKPIPTRLMRTYKDTLVVTKASVKNSISASSDSLSVKGDIAVADMDFDANEPNLADEDVIFTWSDGDGNNQTFTVPAGSFTASKKGHTYKCSKINPSITPVEDANTQITAAIDLDKCTFTVSIKKADIDVVSGDIEFGINFDTLNAEFDEICSLSF
jgi:hypothetical protein